MSTNATGRSADRRPYTPAFVYLSLFSLIVLFQIAIGWPSVLGQSDPPVPDDSTLRTPGGAYEEEIGSIFMSEKQPALFDNLLGNELIVNGGFETGNFSGWTVSPLGNQGWYRWQVTAAGGGDGTTGIVQYSSPYQGLRSAWNGFCCNTTVNPEYIYQDVAIPAGAPAVLRWADKIQSDLVTFCNVPQCGTNTYQVQILNPATNAVLSVLYTYNATGGAVHNTGWIQHTADLSAFAGQTVRLRFATTYNSPISGNYNGPGRAEIDAVSLISGPRVV